MPPMPTSKVTERSQTTLPPSVRRALDLNPGERLGYVIDGDEVRLVNASAIHHEDPVVEHFLAFVGRDIAEHPEHVGALPESLVERARSLSRGIVIDHDADIEGDVELLE